MTKKIENVLHNKELGEINVNSKQQELNSDPQSELYQLVADVKNNTIILGFRLVYIQEEELYIDWGYSSFTDWLKDFSNKSAVKLTKLWDSKKIVKMLLETETPFHEVSNVSIKGLYQIARIQKSTQDIQLTKRLILQLTNSEITNSELKTKANEVIKQFEKNTIPNLLDSRNNSNLDNSKGFFRRVIRRIFSFYLLSNVIPKNKNPRPKSLNIGRSL
ncbi:hypothetical protein [Psychrosphaera aestuarii]|uniref:hypothetical protein n=1 Tax=Psychrosphaera aestuarii TaxID=1266052 RepID=UPI001B335D05|nr:hypothetical protein [Psychrosphaera aestuarii]